MILLTGGAGFIGANILRALNAAGRSDIILVDDLTDGRKCLNIAGTQFFDYVAVDELWTNPQLLRQVSAICHQGALSSTTEKDGSKLMRYNFKYSTRLLELARQNNAPFVYASSAAVYATDLREHAAPAANYERPQNPYGAVKLMFDNYVRARLPSPSAVIGLRYFNVYGPGETHKDNNASVAYHCFCAAQQGRPAKLFAGSAEFKRDFVYIDDVVAVNLYFLTQPAPSGIYNVGTGQPRSFLDVATHVRELTRGPAIEFVPFPAELNAHYQRYTCADLTQLRAAGYVAAFKDLGAGLIDYWHKSFAFGTL